MENSLPDEPQKVLRRMENLLLTHYNDSELSAVMDYIILVARLYEQMSVEICTLTTPDEYIAQYESDYHLIDQLYRWAIEAYYKILLPVRCMMQHKR